MSKIEALEMFSAAGNLRHLGEKNSAEAALDADLDFHLKKMKYLNSLGIV